MLTNEQAKFLQDNGIKLSDECITDSTVDFSTLKDDITNIKIAQDKHNYYVEQSEDDSDLFDWSISKTECLTLVFYGDKLLSISNDHFNGHGGL